MVTFEDRGTWEAGRGGDTFVHSILFYIVSIFQRETTLQGCLRSSSKTITTGKHFTTKYPLNIGSWLYVHGINVTIPSGLQHAGACPSLGSIWLPPLILGWIALVAGWRGAPAESMGLDSCHYCNCLSFLQAPLGSPRYSPIHLGADIFMMADGEMPGRLAASHHQPIMRPLLALCRSLTASYIRRWGQHQVAWQI